MAAGKQENYAIAIKYFDEARRAAPGNPEILFNLGVAESRIPGRELRAVCWFADYLTVTTDTTNAAVVRKEIRDLQVQNQANLCRFIQSIQNDAMQQRDDRSKFDHTVEVLGRAQAEELHIDPKETLTPDAIANALIKAAGLWVRAGYMDKAYAIIDVVPEGMEYSKQQIKREVAIGRAKSGDIAGARRIIDTIPKNAQDELGLRCKDEALAWVAAAEAKAGNLSNAITMARTLDNDRQTDVYDIDVAVTPDQAFSETAQAQARDGDFAGAEETAGVIGAKAKKDNVLELIHAAKKKAKASEGDPWTTALDDESGVCDEQHCSLNTPTFLDFRSHLETLPKDNASKLFAAHCATADHLIMASNYVDGLLKHLLL
jgi:hypothetical protein